MGPTPDYSWLQNLVAATAASVLTWYLARRKQNAEAAAGELDNVVKAISIWKDAAKDLTDMVTELRSVVDKQDGEIRELKRVNAELREEIKQLKPHN